MQDNLHINARDRIMKGVNKIADAVGSTMGTAGQNAIIQCIESPGHYATNDGFSIANAIQFADPLEQLGRDILLEAINRANKQSGDGSSTTCVLTSAILTGGIKAQNKLFNRPVPMDIQRSLENCIPLIEESIKKQTKEVTTENVEQVATISAEDPQIGKTIQEIYSKIGKDGIIYWDISKTSEDSYTIGTGLTIETATYVSPYMCDIDDKGNLAQSIRWKDPKVLLCKQKITSAMDFEKLFSSLYAKDIRELVIFAEGIEVPVIADLVRTRAMRGFKSAVIKVPVLWRDQWWEDLALTSGGKIVGPETGLSLKDATIEDLGSYGFITVTKDSTYIDGIKDVSGHIQRLKDLGDDESLLRASRLNTKTARYFVGARSESALSYKRLKVEDAINAASCALDNGVVVGGGLALFNATQDLPKDTIGGKILREALQAPIKQIIKNAGGSPLVIKQLGGEIGFNSQTQKVENLMEKGIVDPSDVVLNAVRNAIGVVATILTGEKVVTLPEDRQLNAPPIVR